VGPFITHQSHDGRQRLHIFQRVYRLRHVRYDPHRDAQPQRFFAQKTRPSNSEHGLTFLWKVRQQVAHVYLGPSSIAVCAQVANLHLPCVASRTPSMAPSVVKSGQFFSVDASLSASEVYKALWCYALPVPSGDTGEVARYSSSSAFD